MQTQQEIPNPFVEVIRKVDQVEQRLINIERAMGGKSSENEDLTDLDGAMEVTGKARQTLYGLVSKNAIPHFKRGNKLYFSKTALREWIISGKVPTQSEIQNSI